MHEQYLWIISKLLSGIVTDVSVVLIVLAIYIKRKELNAYLVKWEDEYIFSKIRAFRHRAHIKIAKKLKGNERFMKWLNKPVKHGHPDAAWINGQVKVWHDWRG